METILTGCQSEKETLISLGGRLGYRGIVKKTLSRWDCQWCQHVKDTEETSSIGVECLFKGIMEDQVRKA